MDVRPMEWMKYALVLLGLAGALMAAWFWLNQPTDHHLAGVQQHAYFVTLTGDTITDSRLRKIADDYCGSGPICIVMFWDNPGLTPTRMPMSSLQVETMVAQYNRNRNTGMDRLLVCQNEACR